MLKTFFQAPASSELNYYEPVCSAVQMTILHILKQHIKQQLRLQQFKTT